MAHVFSRKSLGNLAGVNPDLQDLCLKVLQRHDCTVISGKRTEEEQLKLVEQGLSKTMASKHLTGNAVDLAPYPIDWENTKRYYYFAGIVMATAAEMGIKIRWGGNWDMDEDLDDQKFMDLVHFEVVP